MTERRRARRFAFQAGVQIGWGSDVLEGTIRDLSRSGMFVETGNTLWVRAEFTARLGLAEPIEVDCVVRRIEPHRGMGVEFKELPEAEAEVLDRLLKNLAGG